MSQNYSHLLDKIKNPVGRPREKTPQKWMKAIMIEVAKNKGLVSHTLIALNLKRDMYYQWVKEFPEFKAWHEEAKLHRQAAFEDNLISIAHGSKGNVKATQMILHNIAPEEYSLDNQPQHIQIGNVNVIQNMSDDELNKKLEYYQRKQLERDVIDVTPNKD